MKRKRLQKSIRKFIRKEKARIRRSVLDVEKQKELINELYKKYSITSFARYIDFGAITGLPDISPSAL